MSMASYQLMFVKVSIALVCAISGCEQHKDDATSTADVRVHAAENRARLAEAEAREAKAQAERVAQEAAQQATVAAQRATAAAQRATAAIQQTTEMLNEEWVLTTGASHSYSFTLTGPAVVGVEMVPVKHADNGVTLRLVAAEDFDACSGRTRGSCRSLGAFDGFKVRSFNHTDTIPAGRWTFFASNTENIINSATVHVRIVTNAGGGRQ
jgi:hypothetical protein